ncbi:MAG: hypothetical protein N3F63_01910 [Thermoplasmata archaeon]|nr:hypothetical protein [Thermoplasmata archaeon]
MQNVGDNRKTEMELLCKGFLLTYETNKDTATAFCKGFLLKLEGYR